MDPQTGFEDDEFFFSSYDPALAESDSARTLSLAEAELELAEPRLSSEQLARAGRFRRPVAVLTGGLAALTAFAFTLQRPSSAVTASASRVEAQPLVVQLSSAVAASTSIDEPVSPPGVPASSPPSAPLAESMPAAPFVPAAPPVRAIREQRIASVFPESALANNRSRRVPSVKSEATKAEPLPAAAATPAVARFPEL